MTAHVNALPGSSVDQREAEYYARFAQTWWDDSGPFWPLHRLNAVRAPFITSEIRWHLQPEPRSRLPLAGVRVLDIGCGGGILAESMARLGARVHGIDVVERNIRIAAAHAAESGLDIRYDLTTAEDLAARGGTYDVVLNMEVVEHVADLEGFMAACCELVRPGGMMFVATINRTLAAWLIAILGAEHVLRWMPKGTHRWSRFRRPAEIKALLGRHGLGVARQTGVAVNPFRKQLFLTPLTQVNYMLSAIRPGAFPGRKPIP
jgi:2-polyprenyl-6-hydroxyphenyl methylase/3-demethylubiquinone-9 3-methyltransferase